MANCQNNMRRSKQGNIYPQRAGYNMSRNSSYMNTEMQRRMNSNTCGCRGEQRFDNRGKGDYERREDDCERRADDCERRSGNCERRADDCERRADDRGRRTDDCKRRKEDNVERKGNSCECRADNRRADSLAGLPLAMAYVPWQEWRKIYDVCEGFHRGTIFEELDMPFLGKGGCNR